MEKEIQVIVKIDVKKYEHFCGENCRFLSISSKEPIIGTCQLFNEILEEPVYEPLKPLPKRKIYCRCDQCMKAKPTKK